MTQDKRREARDRALKELLFRVSVKSLRIQLLNEIIAREKALQDELVERVRRQLEELKETMKIMNAWVAGCKFEKKVDETISILDEIKGNGNTGEGKDKV